MIYFDWDTNRSYTTCLQLCTVICCGIWSPVQGSNYFSVKFTKFNKLEKLMILDETTREQYLWEGRQWGIKKSLEQFQADMEMLFLKKQVNVQSLASIYALCSVIYITFCFIITSSKQRAHMRHSLAADKKRLWTSTISSAVLLKRSTIQQM